MGVHEGKGLFGLTQEEVSALRKIAPVSIYEPQETIFHSGEDACHLHILIEGAVCICNFDEQGNKKVITNIEQEEDMFGEVFLFLPLKVFEHDAIATCTTKVWKIPEAVLQDYPCIYKSLMRVFAQKAYVLNRKVRILSCSTLREKLMRFMEYNQDINGIVELNQGREELAAYLNVARPSLSRELMKMQEEGLIVICKNRIEIKNKINIKNVNL